MITYQFKGFWGNPAHCGLEIYEPREGLNVVVLTELPDNPGTSVTNMAEHLAGMVHADYLASVHPENIVWIEKYPADTHRPSATHDMITFELVRLSDRKPTGGLRNTPAVIMTTQGVIGKVNIVQNISLNAMYSRPQWRRMKEEELGDLLKTQML